MDISYIIVYRCIERTQLITKYTLICHVENYWTDGKARFDRACSLVCVSSEKNRLIFGHKLGLLNCFRKVRRAKSRLDFCFLLAAILVFCVNLFTNYGELAPVISVFIAKLSLSHNSTQNITLKRYMMLLLLTSLAPYVHSRIVDVSFSLHYCIINYKYVLVLFRHFFITTSDENSNDKNRSTWFSSYLLQLLLCF